MDFKDARICSVQNQKPQNYPSAHGQDDPQLWQLETEVFTEALKVFLPWQEHTSQRKTVGKTKELHKTMQIKPRNLVPSNKTV